VLYYLAENYRFRPSYRKVQKRPEIRAFSQRFFGRFLATLFSVIDVIIVWRLDRWGRSLADLVVTLKELTDLGVGFVSLTEALDLTTPSGRAMAGLLAVFAQFEREIIRERVRAGIAQARAEGQRRMW
jgi:DNA invertase Pin-like site-specific DNA recombinase